VAERLNRPSSRYVLLVGELGAARAVSDRWPTEIPLRLRYFIRRDSTTPLNGGDAARCSFGSDIGSRPDNRTCPTLSGLRWWSANGWRQSASVKRRRSTHRGPHRLAVPSHRHPYRAQRRESGRAAYRPRGGSRHARIAAADVEYVQCLETVASEYGSPSCGASGREWSRVKKNPPICRLKNLPHTSVPLRLWFRTRRIKEGSMNWQWFQRLQALRDTALGTRSPTA
jgi:hypothetical protein